MTTRRLSHPEISNNNDNLLPIDLTTRSVKKGVKKFEPIKVYEPEYRYKRFTQAVKFLSYANHTITSDGNHIESGQGTVI